MSELWDNMGPKRVEKQKKIFQEMIEKCPNLIKTINLKI